MFRFVGAVLLVVGTTVGAGLLALPMVTVDAGLFSSIIFMILMCLYMLIPAFYIIHVMMSQQQRGVHLVTMARSTLGPIGVFFLWFSNCFLLYAILAAYISAGGDLVSNYLGKIHLNTPVSLASVIFTGVMAMFVIPGIRVTGFANGVFMVLKACLYIVLVSVLMSHAGHQLDLQEHFPALRKTILVGVASFSYAMILPSVYAYLSYDVRKLKQVIWTGTLISFFIYMFWLLSVHLVIPLKGENGLYALSREGSVYKLASAIDIYISTARAGLIASGFISVCLLTTFLGVSICLSDVIADGLKVRKHGWSGVVVYVLTYLPPVVLVLFFPKIFVVGVNYAGLTCLVYLVMLPSLMIYSARYRKKSLRGEFHSFFNWRTTIIGVILVSILLFIFGLMDILQSI